MKRLLLGAWLLPTLACNVQFQPPNETDGASAPADSVPLQTEAARCVSCTVQPTQPQTVIAVPPQHHHICYEVPATGTANNPFYRYVAACRANDGDCTVDGASGNSYDTYSTSLRIWGAFSVGTFTSHFTFADGSTQSCTVGLGGGLATAGAVLEGYTTDASGLLTTGVWRRHSTLNDRGFIALTGQNRTVQQVSPPSDFVPIGGGVVGAEGPTGTLVWASHLDGGWFGSTVDNGAPQPDDNDVYVIGLNIEGLLPSDVRSLTRVDTTPTATLANASTATFNLPAGFVALGGGVGTWTPAFPSFGLGQYATSSAPALTSSPVALTGWTVSSQDHLTPVLGSVQASLASVNRQVTIGGAPFHFVSQVSSATSGVAAHPSVNVNGHPGEYALSGIGAVVNQPAGSSGNFIWKLKPLADTIGAEVGSKDQILSSPASITGYALGIKLVAGP